MTTLMFPGQGSQVKGMGADVFSKFPVEVKQASECLGYAIDDLCLNDPNQQLNNTLYTQPALYVVEALMYLSRQGEFQPGYFIGHSLGEYVALFAAGSFDFITGLQLVKKRAELMSTASGGGMLAVVNLSQDRIDSLLKSQGLNAIDYANYNSPKQVVLSGAALDISKAQSILSAEATLCMPLRVSGAFHSHLMQGAADVFAQTLEGFEMVAPRVPVIANVNALPYDGTNIRKNLAEQITSAVQWTETIRYLKSKGESEFVEMGPGNVLTRLMLQN